MTATIIEKNGKEYYIDTHHTENRWYLMYTVYEIQGEKITRFVGKFQAMKLDDVIEKL